MGKNNTVKYPGKRVTTNGNQLVAQTEALIQKLEYSTPLLHLPKWEKAINYLMQKEN